MEIIETFLKLKSNLGLYQVLLTTPKTCPEKPTLNVVEMPQLPDIGKSDSKKKFSCLKWTKYNGRRRLSVHFKTDTDKLNIVVYRHRNNLYFKDHKVDLKLTEYQSLWAKKFHLLSYIDITFKSCNVLDKQLFLSKTKSARMDVSF